MKHRRDLVTRAKHPFRLPVKGELVNITPKHGYTESAEVLSVEPNKGNVFIGLAVKATQWTHSSGKVRTGEELTMKYNTQHVRCWTDTRHVNAGEFFMVRTTRHQVRYS